MIFHCTSGTADLVVVFTILSVCFRFMLGNAEAPATDVIVVASRMEEANVENVAWR